MHGLVDAPFRVEPVLLDIEELNRRAHTGELDLTKLSFGAFAGVGDRYRLLRERRRARPRRRAAGRGARASARSRSAPASRSPAARRRRSCSSGSPSPGTARWSSCATTAILGAVESGEVDAGLIIHESRFTYADHGLVKIADLGEWWEGETGLPVPLAGICARADLDGDRRRSRRRSAHRSSTPSPTRRRAASTSGRNSQELSDEVCDQHIALYVNEFSVDLGDEGFAAIERLLGQPGL